MPVWHAAAEVFITPAEVTTGDEMAFEVADELTGSTLASFPLPLRHLRPYHQYDLELVRSDNTMIGAPPRLYITLSLRPADHSAVAGTVLLEFNLDAVDLVAPAEAFPEHEKLLAVARLLGNVDHYVEGLAKAQYSTPSEQVQSPWTVMVPGAGRAPFEVPLYGGVRGDTVSSCQITYTAPHTRAPTFDHVFAFHERLYAAFTPTAGIAFEYYSIPAPGTTDAAAATSHKWSPTYANLKGWSTYKLDQKFRRLATESMQTLELPLSSAGYDPHAVTKLQYRVFEHASHDDGSSGDDAAAASKSGVKAGDGDDGGGGESADDRGDGGGGGTDGGGASDADGNLAVNNAAGNSGVLGDARPPSRPESGAFLLQPAEGGSNGGLFGANANNSNLAATLGGADGSAEKGQTFTAGVSGGELNASILRSSPLPPSSLVTSTSAHNPISKTERDVLLSEMTQKQDVIARLNGELDKRMQAIRELTKELLLHRDIIVKAKTTRAELLRELAQNQEATKVTIQKQDLATIPRDVLEKTYTEMSVRHSVETRRLKEYGKRVPDLQNKLIERNEIEKAHLRLEGTHRRQSARILLLQDRLAKIEKYAAAGTKQMQVVQKLEETLAQQQHERGGQSIDQERVISSALYKRLHRRNKQLHAKLAKMSSSSHKGGGGGADAGDGGRAVTSDPVKAELLRVVAENERLAETNMVSRTGGAMKDETDLSQMMIASELTEKIAILKSALSVHQKDHASKMDVLVREGSGLSGKAMFRQGNKEKSITLDDIGPVEGDPLMDTVHPTSALATSTPYGGGGGGSSMMTSARTPASDGGRAMTPTTFALYQKLMPEGSHSPAPPSGGSSSRVMTPRTLKLYQANQREFETSKLKR